MTFDMNKRKVGSGYEEAAARFLISKGYEIRGRNFRCRIGEIDLIAHQGADLVFVEVKYRASGQYGGALMAVDSRKQKKIAKVAQYYLMTHPDAQAMNCRFDVVGITDHHICLVKNAFDYRE